MTRKKEWLLHICNAAVLVAIGIVLILCFLPAFTSVRDDGPWVLTGFSLHEIGMAFHEYHRTHNCFPQAALLDKDGRPLLSWRVSLLPYLEQAELHSQFHLDEPWDSPHNQQLLTRIPHVYKPASDKSPAEPFGTYFQAFVGPGAAFEGKLQMTIKSFRDGTSQTMLLAEAEKAVPWTKPEDLQFNPDLALPKLGQHSRRGRYYCLTADGAMHALPNDTNPEIIRALITRDGGEPLKSDKEGNWHLLPRAPK
jgi:hypothetical protein